MDRFLDISTSDICGTGVGLPASSSFCVYDIDDHLPKFIIKYLPGYSSGIIIKIATGFV